MLARLFRGVWNIAPNFLEFEAASRGTTAAQAMQQQMTIVQTSTTASISCLPDGHTSGTNLMQDRTQACSSWVETQTGWLFASCVDHHTQQTVDQCPRKDSAQTVSTAHPALRLTTTSPCQQSTCPATTTADTEVVNRRTVKLP